MMSKPAAQRVSLNGVVTTAVSTPWRFILMGGVGAGKTTLLRALEQKDPTTTRKTQMVDYAGWGIDTPGEFVEMGHWRRILVSVSFDAQLIVAIQDATRADSYFPPHYFMTFPQQTIGVITKTDAPQANRERATALLRTAGVTGEIYCVSALTGCGISKLRDDLLNQNVLEKRRI